MGVTAKGFPYPENTDQASQAPLHIQALANAVDQKTMIGQRGIVSIVMPANSSQANGTVGLNGAIFDSGPPAAVLVSLISNDSAIENDWIKRVTAGPRAITAASFGIRLWVPDGYSGAQIEFQVYWLALK